MTARLGPSGYGIFVTVVTFVTISMLFTDLGVNSLTGRELTRRPESAQSILGVNVGLRLTTGVFLIPVIWILSRVAYEHHLHSGEIKIGIVIVACAIPFDAVRSVSLAYFVSRIENHRTAIVNLIMQICFVGLAVAALLAHLGVIGCCAAYLVATAVSSAVAWWGAYSRTRFRPIFAPSRWPRVISQSFSIGVIQITNTVYLKADTLMLSLWTSSGTVAQYGVAYAIISFFLVIPMMYMTSTLPLLTRSGHAELPVLIRRSVIHLSTIGCLVSAGCICAGPGVIRVLAGAKFADAAAPLSILSVSVLLAGLTNVFGYANFSQDRHHRMLLVSIAGLALNVSLNSYAIPHYGVKGAACAVIASELFMMSGTYFVFRSQIGHSIPIARYALRPILAAVVTTWTVRWGLGLVALGIGETLVIGVAVLVLFSIVLGVMGGWPVEIRDSIKRRLKTLDSR
jgi:O-antigen/teichoic acid export membrane protein